MGAPPPDPPYRLALRARHVSHSTIVKKFTPMFKDTGGQKWIHLRFICTSAKLKCFRLQGASTLDPLTRGKQMGAPP